MSSHAYVFCSLNPRYELVLTFTCQMSWFKDIVLIYWKMLAAIPSRMIRYLPISSTMPGPLVLERCLLFIRVSLPFF